MEEQRRASWRQAKTAMGTALRIIRKQPYEKQTYIPFQLVTKENVTASSQVNTTVRGGIRSPKGDGASSAPKHGTGSIP
jgi:hypothetical protein